MDTGTFCSVYPASCLEMNNIDVDSLQLTAANGSNITSHGTKYINIRIANRNYTWTFRLAQVTQHLLGADFWAHYHLLVVIANRILLVTDLFRATPLGIIVCNKITVCSIEGAPCRHPISEYADVFNPELRQHCSVPAKHGVFHHIITSGPPTYSRFRCPNPQKLPTAKASFSEMERMGICSKSSSHWASTHGDQVRRLLAPLCQTSRTLQIVLVVHVSSPSIYLKEWNYTYIFGGVLVTAHIFSDFPRECYVCNTLSISINLSIKYLDVEN